MTTAELLQSIWQLWIGLSLWRIVWPPDQPLSHPKETDK